MSTQDQRIALVTGARKGGISFAIVREFVLAGYLVIMGDRDEEAGIAALNEFRDNDCDSVWFKHTDFANEGAVDDLMDFIASKFGRLDVLASTCGSAGVPRKDNLEDLDVTGATQLFFDNVLSFWVLTRAAVTRLMQHQDTGGVVVGFSTNNGRLAIRKQAFYGAMKQALLPLCRCLTVEYARKRIRFNVVTCGCVFTNGENWQRRIIENPAWPRIEGELNPSGRMLVPEDVAQVVVDICSDRWSMVNGAEIVIDGGEFPSGGDTFKPLLLSKDYRKAAVEIAMQLGEESAELFRS